MRRGLLGSGGWWWWGGERMILMMKGSRRMRWLEERGKCIDQGGGCHLG